MTLSSQILLEQIQDSTQAVRSLDCDRALLIQCKAEAKRLHTESKRVWRLADGSSAELSAAVAEYSEAIEQALAVTPAKRIRIR